MPTAADTCFVSLRHAILSGQYASGERLPPERRLAREHGVHRGTLRAALARLATANLVDVRQGSGYVVRDYRKTGGPDLLADVARMAQSTGAYQEVASDLLMVRRQLARAVLERLAERPPTADALARLAGAVDGFEAAVAVDAPWDTLAKRDLAVVAELVAATGSSVLGLCLNPITSVLTALPALSAAMYGDPQSNLAGWRALLAWLADPSMVPVEVVMAPLAARDKATLAQMNTPGAAT